MSAMRGKIGVAHCLVRQKRVFQPKTVGGFAPSIGVSHELIYEAKNHRMICELDERSPERVAFWNGNARLISSKSHTKLLHLLHFTRRQSTWYQQPSASIEKIFLFF